MILGGETEASKLSESQECRSWEEPEDCFPTECSARQGSAFRPYGPLGQRCFHDLQKKLPGLPAGPSLGELTAHAGQQGRGRPRWPVRGMGMTNWPAWPTGRISGTSPCWQEWWSAKRLNLVPMEATQCIITAFHSSHWSRDGKTAGCSIPALPRPSHSPLKFLLWTC